MRKYKFIYILLSCYLVSLFPCIGEGKSGNLIINPNIDVLAQNQPVGWESSQSSIDAYCMVDRTESYEGLNSSLQIISSGSRAYWLSSSAPKSIPVVGGIECEARFAYKTVGLIENRSKAFFQVRGWTTRGVSTTINSITLDSNVQDWKEVKTGRFTIPNDVTHVYIVIDFSVGPGVIWVDSINLNTHGKIPLKTNGRILSDVISYPSSGLKVANEVRLWSKINTPGLASFNFELYNLVEMNPIEFDNESIRNYVPRIAYMNLRIDRPFYPWFNQPFTLFIGAMPITYSPYLAYLNQDYAMAGSGISIQGVNFLGGNWSGFSLWEQDNALKYNHLGQGVKANYSMDWFTGEMIYTRYLQKRITAPVVVSFEDYYVIEHDSILSLEYKVNESMKIGGLYLTQTNLLPMESMSARKLDIIYQSVGLKSSISLRNFTPGLAPRYRLRRPPIQYARYIGWNPIEKYANQKGIEINCSANILGNSLEINLNRYVIQPECIEKRTQLNLDWAYNKGKTKLGLFSDFDGFSPFRYIEYGIEQSLLNKPQHNLHAILKRILDRTCANNDLFVDKLTEVYLRTDIKQGFLQGISLMGGIHLAEESVFFIKGSCKLFDAIDCTFGYQSVNPYQKKEEIWFDDYFRIHYPGEFINIRSTLVF